MSLTHWLWLSGLPRLSISLKHALLQHFGNPEQVYFADETQYLLVEGITPEHAALLADKSLSSANRVLGECERLGLRTVTLQDADYPNRLKNCMLPPLVLYVQGQMFQFDDEVAIAVVGSRSCSPYALRMGEKIAYQMAELGGLVVSGLAAGGDAAAHRGALLAGGKTAAVIAGGHDIPYPPENRSLYREIAVRGVIVSEYPPGTHPTATRFPARNRLMSGLCLGTLVLEAPAHSGALITAGYALEQGRDLYALPGLADDRRALGSNRLLRDGANLVLEGWDVVSLYAPRFPHRLRRIAPAPPPHLVPTTEQLDAHAPLPEPPVNRKPSAALQDLPPDQQAILRAMGQGMSKIDDLIDETQIPTHRLLSALTLLEIDRMVEKQEGSRYGLLVDLQ